ncbi:MAG: DUF4214 domain-containing protein [Rhodoferax sp.]|nr:DUF4214 domain-containing protein [Rhodoferax sp.]
MPLSTSQVQSAYVAFFNRPADVGGLNFWTQSQTLGLPDLLTEFAKSPEYVAQYAGLTSFQRVDAIYMNLFGRHAESGGLQFWGLALDQGKVTLADVAYQIGTVGAQGTDKTAFANKTSAAVAFTTAVDLPSEMLGYAGAASLAAARAFLSSVTDDASLASAIAPAALDASVATVTSLGNVVAGQTFTLTTGVDSFTGGAGADTFNATNTGAVQSLSSFDTIKGGAGADTLNVLSVGNAFDDTTTSGLTVSGVETAVVTSDRKVVLNASTWTDLANLTVVSAGATSGSTSVKAAATTAVSVTNTSSGGNSTVVDGGSTVNVTSTDASGGGTITVGNTNAPTGAINITSNNTANGATTGSVNVQGGSSVTITQAQFNATNTTNTNGTVTVVGSTATTAVTVNNAAKATASATVAGVNANSVAITDVNGGADVAGKIASATVNNFTTLSITDNALTTLTVAGGSGNIIIDNSGLTTATNKTLALNINGQTGGTLDDADIYTTLNVTTTGANSTLANITQGGVTALTVAGTKVLTLTSTAGLSALKTVAVSGSAGIKADLSAATVTSVDASATSGANTVTVDASKATFTGGAGVDTVTLAATTPTKAISLGAGDDSLNLGALAGTPTGKLDGGTGTDNLTMTAALAATASGSATFAGVVTGFEKVTLTGATNQTIDLAVLGNFNYVTTSGGNGLTLSNLPTGGTLVLNGAGTAYTIGNSAFTAGTNDTVNLTLTDGSGGNVSFASTGITASGVENFAITTVDTQATPSGTVVDSVTLLGNSVKAIAVTGNAGLTLTSTSTALTSVDASGITLGGFAWTSGALAAASTVKGSATGTNTIDASAATGGAVTYTGGTGVDSFTATNGKGNTVTLGDGANTVVVSSGNNTITGGKDADTVTATTGNNTVSLGNGANAFTATTGNNTYTGGTGVDTVTVGGGSNTLTLGTGADKVSITAASANVNTYSTITDAGAGDTITFVDLGTETFNTAKVSLANTAVFQDYANAVIQAGGNASVNGAFGWFQFSGDTYLVQSRHDGSGVNASFTNGTDMVVKLTGLVDLSTATGVGTATLTLV